MAITALKREHFNDIIVFPDEVNFGKLEKGGVYQTKLLIRNNLDLLQRVNIKPPMYNNAISVLKFEGPIAPGMSKVNCITILSES